MLQPQPPFSKVMPFTKQTLKVEMHSDGRNCTLLEPLEYIADDGTRYRSIIGATSDGASTPQAIWAKYPPFGKWWFPALIHDSAFRCTLEQKLGDDGIWQRVQLTEPQANDLIDEAMASQGVSAVDRLIIYNALKMFGATAYVQDLSLPIK